MKKVLLALSLACLVLPILSGCAHYYKIRDPASDKVYYTDDYDDLRSGSIRFKDLVTQQQITLSASEVIRISKDEYRANVHGR
jgi:hypothetical protein